MRTLTNYYRPSSGFSAGSASSGGGGVVLQRPSQLDLHAATTNVANHARLNYPPTTNQANPPNAMFNLYDPDDDEFLSDPGDDLAASPTIRHKLI